MKVPFFEIRRSADQTAELEAAFRRVLDSRQYILGPEVETFETRCARYLGAKHAIGVSSGTDAIIASLLALDIGPGDEVLVPAFTFVATAGAVARVGATPVFVDVYPDTMTINVGDALTKVTKRTRAAIPVHLFGARAPDLNVFGVPIIEDAAQAFGSRSSGLHSVASCHSFFPTKNLAGFGDGGLVTTDDYAVAERVRMIRNHGSRTRYEHQILGGNFRLDALQAALLDVQIRDIAHTNGMRRVTASSYHKQLDGLPIVLPEFPFPGVQNQFVIRVSDDKRDALRECLALSGIGTEVYYPTPLHLQPCFAYLRHREGDFPIAEQAAKEVLALPIFPGLSLDEIEHVCATIRTFFGEE